LEYDGITNPLSIFNITNDLKDPLSKPVFVVTSDVAFANDKRTYRSTKGMALILFGRIFDWLSRLQSTITTSTIEAKLLAVAYLIS
jgi:hypothetical protein